MKERLAEMQEQVQGARVALQDLAERAAALRARVEAVRGDDPPYASVPAGPSEASENGAGQARDPFMPVAPPSPLARSLDRLTNAARIIEPAVGRGDEDDGRFVSDAWEIALINEEGK